ncbi:MAG TPA: serine/threonine protein kinase [Polyangiaceae bacterium]|nr:serine/threonine protein kinase [Polyangiaceae bacterium]
MVEDVFGVVGSVMAAVYHVESVVADGGFSAVYRAHHGRLRVPVALKLFKIPSQAPREQAAFLQLFRSESEVSIRLAASLPAVVRPLHVDVFTSKEGRSVPYLALEWLDGVTLEALIAQRRHAQLPPIALRKLLRLLTPVARSLARAHHFAGPDGALGVVHRNLAPEQLFITRTAGEEVVKVLGFGLGRVKSVASQISERASPGGSGLTAFTPAHGAPEQWAPQQYGQPGPWTDVWGLALCLVEAMLGRHVSAGEPATIRAAALDAERRPTPRSEGIEVSDAVEAVFSRALALEPRARQPDVGVFWDELTAALDQVESSPAAGALEYSPPVRHFVPDLELTPAPVSRRSGEQRGSGPPQAQPGMIELDSGSAAGSLELELDLPPESMPARSSARFASVPPSAAAPLLAESRTSQPPPRTRSDSPISARHSKPSLPAPPLPPLPAAHRSNPSPAARRSNPSPSADVSAAFEAGFVAKIEPRLPEERSLARRLRPAIVLLAAALSLAIFDPIYAEAAGKVFEIAGLRLSLLAGALLLFALALAGRELLREP